jgi:hypothetical protein
MNYHLKWRLELKEALAHNKKIKNVIKWLKLKVQMKIEKFHLEKEKRGKLKSLTTNTIEAKENIVVKADKKNKTSQL